MASPSGSPFRVLHQQPRPLPVRVILHRRLLVCGGVADCPAVAGVVQPVPAQAPLRAESRHFLALTIAPRRASIPAALAVRDRSGWRHRVHRLPSWFTSQLDHAWVARALMHVCPPLLLAPSLPRWPRPVLTASGTRKVAGLPPCLGFVDVDTYFVTDSQCSPAFSPGRACTCAPLLLLSCCRRGRPLRHTGLLGSGCRGQRAGW